ncbi:MAG: cob(I)yrinic acid a,c-diamide adenosyltransferase, partial [Sedimentisphaerales bacterium]|nr:cob(I)yrinic acid a,c-diamide adenosyltransferase [Sedimentisphaerales bacterium]
MAILKKGYIHVYTGDGKGKTTAALGLAWRMLGRGGNVYICQFCKPPTCLTGEACLAEFLTDMGDGDTVISCSTEEQKVRLGRLLFERLDEPWELGGEPEGLEVSMCLKSISDKLIYIKETIFGGEFDLVILDELVFCLSANLTSRDILEPFLDQKPDNIELVLTGRGAPDWLIERADLVS